MNKIELIGTKESIYVEHLDNGMHIFMMPNDKIKKFYITLNVNYGSRDTNFKYDGKKYHVPNGIAHFLEHVTFNVEGTTAHEYYHHLGSEINAYTGYDETVYEVLSTNHFKENLEYLIKYVTSPYMNDENVSKEKGIIKEEIKMYDDDPYRVLYDKTLSGTFISDEYRIPIGGSVSDVDSITLDDLNDVYKAFYVPSNMFVTITGNFKVEEAIAIIHDALGDEEKDVGKKIRCNEPFEVNADGAYPGNVGTNKISVAFKIPKSEFKNIKASDAEKDIYITNIIESNYGHTSMLYEDLEVNGIITEGLAYNILDTDEYYVIIFFASTLYPDYLSKRIIDKFNELFVSNEDFNRKNKIFISSYILALDNPIEMNNIISSDFRKYNYVLNDKISIFKGLKYDNIEYFIKGLKNYKVVVNKIEKI